MPPPLPPHPGPDDGPCWHCSACDEPIPIAWVETSIFGSNRFPQRALAAIYEGAGSGDAAFSTDNEVLVVLDNGIVVPALCYKCFTRGMNAWLSIREQVEREERRARAQRASRGGGRFDAEDDGFGETGGDGW